MLLAPPPPHHPWEFADSAEAQRVASIRPLWLTEGLADLAGKSVALMLGFHEGDVWDIEGPGEVDAACAERLRSPRAAELLPYLGGDGSPPALFTTERAEVAPIFYACAHSLTGFLAAELSAAFLASLFPHIPEGRIEDRIRERAGRSVPARRAEWLEKIGADSQATH